MQACTQKMQLTHTHKVVQGTLEPRTRSLVEGNQSIDVLIGAHAVLLMHWLQVTTDSDGKPKVIVLNQFCLKSSCCVSFKDTEICLGENTCEVFT